MERFQFIMNVREFLFFMIFKQKKVIFQSYLFANLFDEQKVFALNGDRSLQSYRLIFSHLNIDLV